MGKSTTSSSTKQTKQNRRRDRREEQRKREEERQRTIKRNRIVLWVSIFAVVLVVAASIYFWRASGSSSTATAEGSNPSSYPRVDNIICEANEQGTYHVHAHLSLYIDGIQMKLPQNIGIASDQSCLYWLHTHDTTGVIHVEAPSKQTFTLGTFFKEWGEVFPTLQYPIQLKSDGWKVYVNGKPYNGDFNKIELSAHTLITMAYQSPKAPIDTVYNWGDL